MTGTSEPRAVEPSAIVPYGGGALPELPADPDARLEWMTAAWLAKHEQRSRHTYRSYTWVINSWLGWCIAAGIDPRRARSTHVNHWTAGMRVEKTGKPISRRTKAQRISALSSWYGYMLREEANLPVEQRTVLGNPAAGEQPAIDATDSPTVALTPAQSRRFAATAIETESPRDAAMLLLMLGNGLRVSSVQSVRVEHLVWRTIDADHDDEVPTLRAWIKGDRYITVRLHPFVHDAIERYLAWRTAAEGARPRKGLLFVTGARGTGDRRSGAGGKTVSAEYLDDVVRRVAYAAKIRTAGELSNHSLRHTCITEALEHAPTQHVQDMFGHKSERTTRAYNHRKNMLKNQVFDQVADRLFAPAA